MNLQILSDLHLEFHGGAELDFIDALDPEGVDAIVVAGDLCPPSFLRYALRALCERYKDVVYVTGNHEYYRAGLPELHGLLLSLRTTLRHPERVPPERVPPRTGATHPSQAERVPPTRRRLRNGCHPPVAGSVDVAPRSRRVAGRLP